MNEVQPTYHAHGSPMVLSANQMLVAKLAEAPSQIQPILTSMATNCQPEAFGDVLVITLPFDAVQDAVQKARTLHRTDILASVLILSMTMAVTVIGVLLFIK